MPYDVTKNSDSRAVKPTIQTYYNHAYQKHTVKLGQRYAQTGARAEQDGVHSCALRMVLVHSRTRRLVRRACVAVNDNQYMTLICRLKPIRILRLCTSSNTVCTAAMVQEAPCMIIRVS